MPIFYFQENNSWWWCGFDTNIVVTLCWLPLVLYPKLWPCLNWIPLLMNVHTWIAFMNKQVALFWTHIQPLRFSTDSLYKYLQNQNLGSAGWWHTWGILPGSLLPPIVLLVRIPVAWMGVLCASSVIKTSNDFALIWYKCPPPSENT